MTKEKENEMYEKLANREFKSVAFFRLKDGDKRVNDLCELLERKKINYVISHINSRKYGKGIEVKLR